MGLAKMLGMDVDYQASTPQADAGALTYQGNEEMRRLQARAEGAQRNQTQMGLGNYNQSRAQQGWSRDSQSDAMSLARRAANGELPSAGEAAMRSGTDQAIRAGYAMANSARGPGAAGAQRTAAYAAGDMSMQAVQQGAQMRAAELAQAREQYMSAATQQRMADLQAQGLDANTAYQQAQVELQNRQINNQYALGLEGLSTQIGLGTLGARTSGQQMNVQGSLGAQGINAGIAQANAQADAAALSGVVGAATGVATGGMSIAAANAAKGAAGGGGGRPF